MFLERDQRGMDMKLFGSTVLIPYLFVGKEEEVKSAGEGSVRVDSYGSILGSQ